MPELRPKEPLTAQYVATYLQGKAYTTEPAIKRYVGAFAEYPYEYTTDLEASGFQNSAVKITFDEGTILFLDSDEVIL